MNENLNPCPFCGGGETIAQENSKPFPRLKYRQPTSIAVIHRCTSSKDARACTVTLVGQDRASAIAAWNQRAEVALPGVDESFEDRMSDWAHGDALDADRYRIWRDNMIADTGPAFHGVVAAALPPGVGVDRRPTAEEWDAAIDAARAAQAKEGGDQ